MGVLPTSRMKKSWEMRLAGTARRAGRRSSRRPKRWGWLGYCNLSYSVRATCAFSCRDSTWAGSVKPHASERKRNRRYHYFLLLCFCIFSILHCYANLNSCLNVIFGPFKEQLCLFALLPRVRWEDWPDSYNLIRLLQLWSYSQQLLSLAKRLKRTLKSYCTWPRNKI